MCGQQQFLAAFELSVVRARKARSTFVWDHTSTTYFSRKINAYSYNILAS